MLVASPLYEAVHQKDRECLGMNERMWPVGKRSVAHLFEYDDLTESFTTESCVNERNFHDSSDEIEPPVSEAKEELGRAWYVKIESQGMFDPRGILGERDIRTRSTLRVLSSPSTKGRAGGGDDSEKGGRWKSPRLQVEVVMKRRGMLNN